MAVKRVIKRNAKADIRTINECADEFLEEKENTGLSPQSIRNYEFTINRFLNYHNMTGKEDIKVLEPSMFYKWNNHMRAEGLSEYSIKHYTGDISTFLNWAYRNEYIDEPIEIKRVKAQESRPKTFTEEELEALLEKPKKTASFSEWRTWAVVNFILATGARAKTVCSMKIEDLNFSRREIIYQHMKTKQAMTVPMSASLETALKEYMRMWRDEPTGYLFPNVGDEPLTTDALRQAFERYCKPREVKTTSVHALRHQFAAEWCRNNGNTFALQKILGHSTLNMTQKYVRLFGEDLKRDYESYSALDNIKKNSKRTQVVKRSK